MLRRVRRLGALGGRRAEPEGAGTKVRLNFLSAELKCDLSDAFARERQPKHAEGCGTLRGVVKWFDYTL
jgi:hypothetical protein